ncbi:MAG TPA: hypothetical protein PK957_01410 [Candidatus Dojkabacteria bacterium]|nr:hypothetical protein [Candidatus Dojkabacteria bacterium]HQF36445.1 hypothetical protein [Candidatus Dojkabacteria bacterium]
MYSELLTIAGESLIGRNKDYFSPKGIFDVGLLKSLIDKVVPAYVLSSSNLGKEVASD